MKKLIALLLLLFLLPTCFVSCDSRNYKQALKLIEQGKYEEAYSKFEQLGNYKDSKEQLKKFRYLPVQIISTDATIAPITIFYKDSTIESRQDKHHDGYLLVDTYIYQGNQLNQIKHSTANHITTFTYDTHGNLLQEATFFDGKMDTKRTYSYNSDNTLKKVELAYPFNYTKHYLYDSNGKLISNTYCDGYINYTTNYTYNSNGQLMQSQLLFDDSSYSEPTLYTYNKNGTLSSIKGTNTLGPYTTEIKYELVYSSLDVSVLMNCLLRSVALSHELPHTMF